MTLILSNIIIAKTAREGLKWKALGYNLKLSVNFKATVLYKLIKYIGKCNVNNFFDLPKAVLLCNLQTKDCQSNLPGKKNKGLINIHKETNNKLMTHIQEKETDLILSVPIKI